MKLPDFNIAKTRGDIPYIKEFFKLNNEAKNYFKNKTYHLKTYGCQMNEHDSENIKALLEELGFTYIEEYEQANLVLLNTCSIRENAHNKAFGMLGRLKHLKEERPDLIVGLCGCMAQEEVVVNKIIAKYKWVNFVFGTHNINHLPDLLLESIKNNSLEVEVFSREGNLIEGLPIKRDSLHKAYVNIIYGCDKFCTYCIVPFTRGKQRSRDMEDIISEVLDLIKNNYKEVTLLGQNVNAYGKDLPYGYGMEELLENVAKTNIPRIRFVTSHPWDFTDKMIEIIAKYPNIAPSIHLPVQSGSSRILKLMGRRYTKEEYVTLFHKLKEKIPDVAISTDIIVGFPGEEKEDFIETLNLVDECKFDNAFTFIFSKREGTPACKLEDNTSMEEKEARLQVLNKKVNNYFLSNNKKLINKIVSVLVDGENEKIEGIMYGYTDTNKLINFKGDKALIGSIVNIKITTAKTWSLDGEIYEQTSVR